MNTSYHASESLGAIPAFLELQMGNFGKGSSGLLHGDQEAEKGWNLTSLAFLVCSGHNTVLSH
jgi:hypothetical protein